jgi:hypothetical protein
MRGLKGAVLGIAAIAGLAGYAATARAGGFTLGSVKGFYVLEYAGSDITSAPGTPFNGLGLVWADGNGNLKGDETFNQDGTVCRGTVTGTYTVGPAGEGVAALDYTPASTSTCTASTTDLKIIVRDLNNVHLIGTDSTEILGGGLHRQTDGL